MKWTFLSITILALAAAIAASLLAHHCAELALLPKQAALQQQAVELARLSTENQRLSNELAQSSVARPLSEDQLSELLKLRNEARQLRETVEPLRAESSRIRAGLPDLNKPPEPYNEDATALRQEVQIPPEVKQARLAELRQWLDAHPEERIPEFRLISEDKWLDLAGGDRVTDEEYRLKLSLIRNIAEMDFERMARPALKQYAAANDGQFPADLSQLNPYFTSPVDDDILQRYMIVPANSLTFLGQDWNGGDSVITQKAPVNEKSDMRFAIGLTSMRGTVAPGRWGTTH